ncbi:hypothetical protein [Oceanotoga teriensis]|uniref:hypothetical protein n=1 Tax=Oceanotoga teriensis TaxID=515440 RepID=UPI00271301B0|nr:hypothetical protein [Oceanotoga teriensis]MDO7977769.1 hypothetical protein [Oceanotoga teriensis]
MDIIKEIVKYSYYPQYEQKYYSLTDSCHCEYIIHQNNEIKYGPYIEFELNKKIKLFDFLSKSFIFLQ